MGDGGVLPDQLEAKNVIVPALNDMFRGQGLQDTRKKLKALHDIYGRQLGKHQDKDHGARNRRRTLRHLAWLLTDEMLDIYPYDNSRFRLWLRYLTWIEHGPWKNQPQVIIDGQGVNDSPAKAIKETIYEALTNAPGNTELA